MAIDVEPLEKAAAILYDLCPNYDPTPEHSEEGFRPGQCRQDTCPMCSIAKRLEEIAEGL